MCYCHGEALRSPSGEGSVEVAGVDVDRFEASPT